MRTHRILVVDDLKDVRDMLLQILNGLGYEAYAANDGTEALEKLEDNPFDMVISDVKMPSMDGLSLLRLLRQRSPELPVVLMAGHKSSVTLREAARCNADGFLQKPFRIAQLGEMLEKVLNDSERH